MVSMGPSQECSVIVCTDAQLDDRVEHLGDSPKTGTRAPFGDGVRGGHLLSRVLKAGS